MHSVFIDLYRVLKEQIDTNRNNTHKIPDKSDNYVEDKEDVKSAIRKILNTDPSKMEPLFSRMAKCNAIVGRTFDAHVFDDETDKNFTDVNEFLNGSIENGFSGISFLVEFNEEGCSLDESVYVRIDDCGCFHMYDLKPSTIIDFQENSDTLEDTSNFGEFKKDNPIAASYVEKWQKSNKDLGKELAKWEDMLWLGRSLFNTDAGNYDCDPEIKSEIIDDQNEIIEKWKDDPDFNKYMFKEGDDCIPDEEYGDSHWREISCNVGALRYILFGEWDLDS